MAEDQVFKNPHIKSAMDELMKTEEGKKLAEKLENKLKELSDKFQGLSGDEKKKFMGEFREKFSDSFGDIKDSLKMKVGENVNGGDFKFQEEESGSTSPLNYQTNYLPFLIALLFIVLIFG